MMRQATRIFCGVRSSSLLGSGRHSCIQQRRVPEIGVFAGTRAFPMSTRSRGRFEKQDKGEEIAETPHRKRVDRSVEKFKARVESGEATLEETTACLTLSQTYAHSLPPKQLTAYVKELALGKYALVWFRREFSIRGRNHEFDKPFAGPLCWHLLTEGREDDIWSWIRHVVQESDMVTPPTDEKGHVPRRMWTSHLTGALINNLISMAPRKHPNAALRAWQQLVSICPRPTKQEKHFAVVWHTAAIGIMKQLRQVDCPPANTKLYDQFVKQLALSQSAERIASNRAYLALYHPSTPDATILYDMVKERHPQESEQLFAQIRPSGQVALAHKYLRAIYILRLNGEESKATHLAGIVERQAEIVWRGRNKVWKDLDRDSRLSGLRAQHRSGAHRDKMTDGRALHGHTMAPIRSRTRLT